MSYYSSAAWAFDVPNSDNKAISKLLDIVKTTFKTSKHTTLIDISNLTLALELCKGVTESEYSYIEHLKIILENVIKITSPLCKHAIKEVVDKDFSIIFHFTDVNYIKYEEDFNMLSNIKNHFDEEDLSYGYAYVGENIDDMDEAGDRFDLVGITRELYVNID